MIAEQAEHDQAAADAAAADFEANEKKRPAPKTFTRSDDETPVEGVEEATSKCFRCGGIATISTCHTSSAEHGGTPSATTQPTVR